MWILLYINITVQEGITALPVESFSSAQECSAYMQDIKPNATALNEHLVCLQLLIAEEKI